MDENVNIQNFTDHYAYLSNSWWPVVISFIIAIISTIRAYMRGPSCPSDERIDGKIVIITGSSSGIGKETAVELARRGGHIILAVRDEQSGISVATIIKNIPGAKVEVKIVDLSSLTSIKKFVQQLTLNKVDILINNAGIAFHPQQKSVEGFEMHFVSNYLGHFLLTQLLLPKLKAANQGRIINITAQAYIMSSINLDDLNLENNFSAREAFAQSKLALIMMARHMSFQLKETSVTINAVNPGLVRGTKHMKSSLISQRFLMKVAMGPCMWLLMKNPTQGAQTSIYATVAQSLSICSGKYLCDCKIEEPAEIALDDEMAAKLYDKSMVMIQPYLLDQIEDEV